jgi:hypothetical protein
VHSNILDQEEKRRIILDFERKEKAEEEALAKLGRVKKKDKVGRWRSSRQSPALDRHVFKQIRVKQSWRLVA